MRLCPVDEEVGSVETVTSLLGLDRGPFHAVFRCDLRLISYTPIELAMGSDGRIKHVVDWVYIRTGKVLAMK
nr:hypothetical protein CFP56_55949 [Quercus suber]